ncbi:MULTISPECIES: hypothetical protein [unclassified Variovorax]|uniref:hypothetical protein n=1 Tax=unclassified Variovorax TaxID=663243 RepID=UPI00076C3977|nr:MULTISPECIES: hypothetical protein [unclassified Variovorax]KWT72099.1 hypothetical protein APY03_6396 [Variovorax sp. WDL1]PNG56457.1 hypothetical protein CHC07_02874 [Variovorax sp. B4]PNG57880.1 hypothetical protein CHC06_02876 [Variovorax sp. B2]VTV09665.1 hypothetical protein WDL1CHR_00751 [Variovorax sp. WDL1]
MPMELLRHIAQQPLPYTVYAPAELDKLRVLRAAELVSAFIPPAESLPSGCESHKPAQVLAITPKGHQALEGQLEDATDP